MPFLCHKCAQTIEVSATTKVGRRDSCPKCGCDLHVCLNCQHYDRSAYRECREPVAEGVQNKDKSNFCDHFTPSLTNSLNPLASSSSRDSLLKNAEALFKKK